MTDPQDPSFNPPPPPPPMGQSYQPAPPPPAGYGYGQFQAAPGGPPGTYFDPNSGLTLPDGVELASVGRRIGAYFLSILLVIVTLVIGYIVWGLILWSRGTSPAFKVLGVRVYRPATASKATFGTMALRNIVGGIATGILGIITELVSFVMFLTGKQRKSLADAIASTVVVYDPNGILDR